MRRHADAAAAVLLAAYAWALFALQRHLLEPPDGVNGILNALRLGGLRLGRAEFLLYRPPAGSVLLAPAARWAWAAGGPEKTLVVSHAFHIVCAAALVGLFWFLLSRRRGPGVAALLCLFFALSPVLLLNAPFAFFDVAGAAAALLFLEAARRGARPLTLLYFGALMLLSKYHLFILLPVPALCAWLGRRNSARLWLLPFAAAALAMAVGAVLMTLLSGSASTGLAAVGITLRSLFDNNPWGPAHGGSDRLFYLRSLAYQLGVWPLFCAAAGSVLAARRRRAPELLPPLAVFWSLACFTLIISNTDSRYMLFLLAPLYDGLGEALEWARAKAGRAGLAAAAASLLLLGPWSHSYESLAALLDIPQYHSRMPFELARYTRARAGKAACVTWFGADLPALVAAPPHTTWGWTLPRRAFDFYAAGAVRTTERPADCASPLAVVPGSSGEEPARVYDDGAFGSSYTPVDVYGPTRR